MLEEDTCLPAHQPPPLLIQYQDLKIPYRPFLQAGSCFIPTSLGFQLNINDLLYLMPHYGQGLRFVSCSISKGHFQGHQDLAHATKVKVSS